MAEAPTRCPLRKTFRKSRAGPSSLSWRTHFNLGMGACTFPETGLDASELHIFRKPFIARCCSCTARSEGLVELEAALKRHDLGTRLYILKRSSECDIS
jgi:hypothetical protein